MVPERRDNLIMLISNINHCRMLRLDVFFLIYEAHRRRNTLPSLAGALEKLLHPRISPFLEVSRTIRKLRARGLRNSGGEALTCVALDGAILPESQLTLNVTASPSVVLALTRWLLALRTLRLSLLGPSFH
jgi:hypothetical protein